MPKKTITKKQTKKIAVKKQKPKQEKKEIAIALQPEINIGLVGHVDSGKTTLVHSLSGRWTDTHSEEKKRGITIRLGYADILLYKCPKCKSPECYTTLEKCKNCNSTCTVLRKVSFVDAPGHETLMATMLCGAAIMDYAILVISANEKCPQPQTKEHLMALTITGIKGIIIVQNKIDLVTKEQALQNYKEIKEFIKGTIAENSVIIPISAQNSVNIDILIEAIQNNFKSITRDLGKDPLMFIARSFDVNKPGASVQSLLGGVLGGSIKYGLLKINDKIEISPGLRTEKEGRVFWQPIFTEIAGIKTGNQELKEAHAGGSIAILTKLDPSLVKADSLTGNLLGHTDKLPKVWYEFYLQPILLERIVGAKDEILVEPIKRGETLMLNVNSAATVGTVVELKKNLIYVKLKIAVCANIDDRFTISRMLGSRWRLIGYSNIVEPK